METNSFIFTFRNTQDKLRVLNQAPWNFKGHLLVLKQGPTGATLKEINLNHAPFQVQIHGLPLDYITLENAIQIGRALGTLIKVEEDPLYGLALRKFIRLKVEIDVIKALQQGFMMPRLDNSEIWIAFKYEKLPDFCYACGRLGHSQVFCGFLSSPTTRLIYGPWIKAKCNNYQGISQAFQQTGHGQPTETDFMGKISSQTNLYGNQNREKPTNVQQQNLNLFSRRGQQEVTERISTVVKKNNQGWIHLAPSTLATKNPSETFNATNSALPQDLVCYSEQRALISPTRRINIFTVEEPPTESHNHTSIASKISLLSSNLVSEQQVKEGTAEHVHSHQDNTLPTEATETPWNAQWQKIYSAFKEYKSLQTFNVPGPGPSTAHQATFKSFQPIETCPHFKSPLDLSTSRPIPNQYKSAEFHHLKDSKVKQGFTTDSTPTATQLATSLDHCISTVIHAPIPEKIPTQSNLTIQLLEDSSSMPVGNLVAHLEIPTETDFISGTPEDILSLSTQEAHLNRMSIQSQPQVLLPSKRPHDTESFYEPTRKSQRLNKTEKPEQVDETVKMFFSEESTTALTLMDMQSGTKGKEKKSKGKGRLNPYSKPVTHSHSKSKSASEIKVRSKSFHISH
ncbi:uncharacterized protein LOC122314076 isoform X2 [Carya illinoinensis]|uniref:uncharacterized protein LOC122314076 isoform X2 n=1 Tax=Carya illinoinensis TaxID=32201 RepID=UPI001C718345|nr:uncharacterized protein LOC122314076 isoform X2 [Carya illinoinensis]XP_042985403.1 uncharacterized protein LOC122314076 isoform X2 [Carya illinoinensis]